MSDTASDLAREFAALNAATTKAHELLADLRTERRLLAEDIKAVNGARALLRQDINEQCGDLITDCIQSQLGQAKGLIEKAFHEAGDRAVKRITDVFAEKVGLT